MEAKNDWYEGIEKEISSLKDKITKKDYKLYELDLLLRVAKRVVGFSSDCEYCQCHRNDISNLVTDLGNLPEITQEEVADYGRTFRSILKHLEKHHIFRWSAPNPLIPLGIALVIPLIYFVIADQIIDRWTEEHIGIRIIGILIGIIFMIIAMVLGIFRLFRKPI